MANARNKAPRKKTDAAREAVSVLSVRFSAADRANRGKLRALHALNDHCTSLKNAMSRHIFEQRPRVLADAYELGGDYRLFDSDQLNAWERQAMFQDVLGTYQRRLSELQARYVFVVQSGWRYATYQKKVTKGGQVLAQPGWVKPGTFELTKRRSGLAQAANFLLRCHLPSLELDELSDKARVLLAPLAARPALWERLLALVASRQQRLLDRFKLHQFTTGTHRLNAKESRCRLVRDEDNRRFRWFFELRLGTGKAASFVRLPLTFDARYFAPAVAAECKEFVLKVRRGKVHIGCTRQAPVPVFKDPGLLVGLDANTKHNLLASSQDRAYDYDRLHLDTLLAQLTKLDAVGTKNLDFRQQARLAKLVRRNEAALKHRLHEVLNDLEAEGVTDLVLEDLGTFKGTMLSRHPQFEQKYSRLIRLLRLSSLKDWLASQAEKRGMRVHLTHAAYSSQECPVCHHVDRANRATQETFCCVACGHTAPADFVSAHNLAQRLLSDVLRLSLHAFDEFGRAKPLALPRARLKSILQAQGAGDVIDLLAPATPTKLTSAANDGRLHEETPPIAA